MKLKVQRGMVLISVLLILMVLTILVLNLLESNILETKMSNYQFIHLQAFVMAESGLQIAAAKLKGKAFSFPVANKQLHYQIKLQQKEKCYSDYRILSQAVYRHISVSLRGVFRVYLNKKSRWLYWMQIVANK